MKVTSSPVLRADLVFGVETVCGAEGVSGDGSCEGAVAGPLSDMRNSSLFVVFSHPRPTHALSYRNVRGAMRHVTYPAAP